MRAGDWDRAEILRFAQDDGAEKGIKQRRKAQKKRFQIKSPPVSEWLTRPEGELD
jgi:hypothetical protein